jgi:tRNA(fMet)-specific endonuclease VapC
MIYSHMLDTNMLSTLVSGRAERADRRLQTFSPKRLCISSITVGEVLFGLAKQPEATRRARFMHAVLAKFAILAWTQETAAVYGRLRAEMRHLGKALAPLDMLIAAHALEAGVTLVSNDRAFRHVPGLTVEDWTEA